MFRKNIRQTENRKQALQSSIAFQNLGEPVQRILLALNNSDSISEDDLNLLSKIKVRQLAKVFDMLSCDQDPEDIYLWLKSTANENVQSEQQKRTGAVQEEVVEMDGEDEIVVDDEDEEGFVMDDNPDDYEIGEDEELPIMDDEDEFEIEDEDEERKRQDEVFEMEPEIDDEPEEEGAEESMIPDEQRIALEQAATEAEAGADADEDQDGDHDIAHDQTDPPPQPSEAVPVDSQQLPTVQPDVPPTTDTAPPVSPTKTTKVVREPMQLIPPAPIRLKSKAPKNTTKTESQWKLPLPQVTNPQFLKAHFAVLKYVPKKLSPKQTRIWVVDHFHKAFYNLAFDGTVRKEHAAHKLLQLEKSTVDPRRVRMMFLDASHSYELLFPNAIERERFYETASAIRPSIRVFAPSLTNPDTSVECTSTTIDGMGSNTVVVQTPSVKGNIVARELTGECKINASRSITEPVHIWVGTLNLSGRGIVSLEPLLPKKYDMYAISFIEVDASEESIKNAVTEGLGNDFLVLANLRLQDMHIVISCRKKLICKLSNVEGSTRRIQHKSIGTRGAAAISLCIHETSICFISCQLASGLENVHARNMNLRDIAAFLILGKKEVDILQQFQHVILFGNFNYRVEADIVEGLGCVQEGEYSKLLQKCQFNRQIFNEGLLHGFMEPPVNFRPTYRFRKGSLEYNMAQELVPSYTDRILIKSMPNAAVSCTHYGVHEDFLIGEHLPVSATFTIRALRPCISCFETVQKPKVRFVFTHIVLKEYHGSPVTTPLLSIFSDFCEGTQHIRSFGTDAGGHFRWGVDELVPMDTVNHVPEYLEMQHFLLVIKDQFDKNRIPRGTGCLSLKRAVIQQQGIEQEHIIDLCAFGRRVGALLVRFMWVAKK